MRFLSVLFWMSLFTFPSLADANAGTDYVLTIDGVEYPLALGVQGTVTLKSGAQIPVSLSKNEFSRFQKGDLSFEYPGQYTVASSVVDVGIMQHILVTGLGTMVLVQSYDDGPPVGLLELMYAEMKEEPEALGLVVKRTKLSRTIENSTGLTGLRMVYNGPKDDVTIDMALTLAPRGGFFAMSMHDSDNAPDESAMIERFWESVTLKDAGKP